MPAVEAEEFGATVCGARELSSSVWQETEDSLEDVELTPAATEEDSLCPTDEVRQHAWHDDTLWQGRRCIWFGRIRVFRVLGTVVFIGPHWYASIIMLASIIAVGGLFLVQVAPNRGFVHAAAGTICTLLSIASFLQCALADPGILRPWPNGHEGLPKVSGREPLQLIPSSGRRSCNACGIVQPKGCLHCEFCEVCVSEYDHHCPWMSKCIGGKNLSAFYSFLCMSLASLAYIVIATITSPEVLHR